MKEIKMIEKEITLKPLISGYTQTEFADKPKGTPYYEQILVKDEDYPIAMVHIDIFWPGRRDNTPKEKYDIYDTLLSGQELKIIATFKSASEYLEE